MRRRVLPVSLTAVLLAVMLAGCGERTDTQQTETQPVTETEAVTEIQIETQPVTETEAVTEAPQTETEAPQTETEPQTEEDVPLTMEQEQERESEFAEPVTYFANDDINVRETPSTENSDNIISSYDQGQEVTVVAKTPHWYKVQKDDYTGYVYKAGLSETTTEPKSDEEREAAVQAETSAPASQEASSAAEPVSGYADSFPIQIRSDANIRASASEKGDVIGVVNAGTQMTALGESGDWYQVDYNGNVGYVNKNLVG